MLQFNMYSNHYELGCIFGCNRLYYSWNKSKTCYTYCTVTTIKSSEILRQMMLQFT